MIPTKAIVLYLWAYICLITLLAELSFAVEPRRDNFKLILSSNSYETLRKRLGDLLRTVDDKSLLDGEAKHEPKYCASNVIFDSLLDHNAIPKRNVNKPTAFYLEDCFYKGQTQNSQSNNGLATNLTERDLTIFKEDDQIEQRSALQDRKEAKLQKYKNFLMNFTTGIILNRDMYNRYRYELDRLYEALYRDGSELAKPDGRFEQHNSPVLHFDKNPIDHLNSIDQPSMPNINNSFSQIPEVEHIINRRKEINRRDIGIGGEMFGTVLESSYPSVLTSTAQKTIKNVLPARNLLHTVAEKLNTSTLDLATKLATMTDIGKPEIKGDPKLSEQLQKYIAGSVLKSQMTTSQASPNSSADVGAAHENALLAPVVRAVPVLTNTDETNSDNATASKSSQSAAELQSILSAVAGTNVKSVQTPGGAVASRAADCSEDDEEEEDDDEEECKVSEILEKVLSKLEHLQKQNINCQTVSHKESPLSPHPEGSPCDIVGSWNANEVGLRFDITAGGWRHLSSAEHKNQLLHIAVKERTPPKHHEILGIDWVFMGSAMKRHGGPFYMYGQNHASGILTTFAGYCRTCGGIDTIFGSWTFVHPSTDCQDIIASAQHRRDIMRRNNMEAKQIKHYKDWLFKNSKLAKKRFKGAHHQEE